MRRRPFPRLSIVGALVSLVAALVAAVDVIGQPERLVDVIAIFTAGMGGGAALLKDVVTDRAAREGKHIRTGETPAASEDGGPAWK